MHCVPMCGGFVLGQVADRMARLPAARLCEWQRIGRGALLPYHLGRLTTYAGLGALGGAATRPAAVVRLRLGGAAAAGRRAVPGARARGFCPGWIARPPAGRAPSPGWRSAPAVATRWASSLGFLPCGFLYAALAATAASGSPLLGALGMLAFGLGTMPALVAVGIAGQAAGRRWQRGVAAAAPAVMLLNAALLAVLALRGLVIDM